MKDQEFHIAGGGIAGLTSAIAIANCGNRAVVMEKAASFEAIGAGIQLGPNAARALQKLGAWDAVEPFTCAPAEILIRDGQSGKILKRSELGQKFTQKFGLPYRVAHRAELHSALLTVAKAKPNIQIETNVEVSEPSQFNALIAADGLWSTTRETLFPGTKAKQVSDLIHRALISNPTAVEDSVNLWLFPGGHVVHYLVGNPQKLNVVAVTQGADPKIHFQNACDALQGILTQAPSWSLWPAAFVPPLQNWTKNNVLLMGDAAHGTLPYLAQGAAMALEDAACLHYCIRNHEEPQVAFAAFENQRKARTLKLHTQSLRMGQIYHAGGLISWSRNMAMALMPDFILANQTDWIYRG